MVEFKQNYLMEVLHIMHNVLFFLIMLLVYAALALICISFNIIYKKKYLNLISMSHIFGILTVLFCIFNTIIFGNYVIKIFSVTFFLCANFLGILALLSYFEINVKAYYKYIAIALIIIDAYTCNNEPNISVIIHKDILMLVYICIGIFILTSKHNKLSSKIFASVSLIFPSVQFMFQIVIMFTRLPILKILPNVDLVSYELQALTYSFFIIFITIEDASKKFSSHVNVLQEEVKDKEKKLTEYVELDKLKSEFLANISHELRTPINVIFSSVQLYEINLKKSNCKSDKNLNKYIDIMKKNCYRLTKLSNNLIDMSKIDAGIVDLNLQNVDIIKVVEDTTLSVVPFAESKDIQIVFDTEIEELLMACDIDKIERIILNLLSNAIKFTQNHGKIKVYTCFSKNKLQINVEDNGPGICKDMHENIFNRFTQISDTFIRKNEGSGIGLSLVKSLVEMHNGEVFLESEENKGCKFKIELPYRQLDINNKNSEDFSEINMKKVEIEFSDL